MPLRLVDKLNELILKKLSAEWYLPIITSAGLELLSTKIVLIT